MSQINESEIRKVLDNWVDPYLDSSLEDAGAIQSLDVEDGRVHLSLRLGFPVDGYRRGLTTTLQTLLEDIPGVTEAKIEIKQEIASHAVQGNLKPVGKIRNIVAVASGKGGVGKSTTAVNLALALAAEGARAGVLDADIYGPSQPRMLGLSGKKPISRDNRSMEPLVAYGIECMSIGFLIDEEQPMVWRGPMVTQALTQLISDTNWGPLDYLIVDMPPGTGDIQLTLSQRVPVSGAVIVTTPQDIALMDARKGLNMFRKVNVEVLGIIENMSTHICSKCGHEEHVFGAGGGGRMAQQFELPLLGEVPLDIRIREEADSGRPSVVADPSGPLARAYREIALRMSARLSRSARSYAGRFPNIVVENT